MTRTADVLIQAGHEGRTSGLTGAHANGLREIDITPRISDAAVAWLTARGVSVLRDTADTGEATVKIAVAVHLDGTPHSGAQFLYDDATDKPLADHLRRMWKVDVGYPEWLPDNTSWLADDEGWSRYYGFRKWTTTDGEVVFELGSLGQASQADLWRQPGYAEWAGRWLGHGIATRLGVASTAPGPFGSNPEEPAPPGTPILGPATATTAQATAWLRRRGAHQRALNVVSIYFDVFPDLGVDPAVGIAQMAKETRYGTFIRHNGEPATVTPDHHNWAGIKTTRGGSNDDPAAHETFPDDLTGITAQRDHLFLYADSMVPNTPDPRHFPERAGTARTVEALNGKWAGPTYGTSLVSNYLVDLQATRVSPGSVWSDRDEWESWESPSIEKAIASGILKGVPQTDGTLHFDPRGDLDRGQLVTILDRLGMLG
jgi:hypothetical protein